MAPRRAQVGFSDGAALRALAALATASWLAGACEAPQELGASAGDPQSQPTPSEPHSTHDQSAQQARAGDRIPSSPRPTDSAPPLARPSTQEAAPPVAPDAIAHRDRAGNPRPFVGMTMPQDAVLDILRQATPTAFRPVGSTSTVFKMTLDAPFAAAFKSATHKRPNGPAAEVAAYRLARCLGLSNVPPAISRRIPLAALRVAFQDQPGHTWDDVSARMLRDEFDNVRGVAIYWIPDMVDLGIDGRAGLTRWGGWLRQGQPLPTASRSVAAHISTMLVFDYLIGNFDRFSGGNARGDVAGEILYLRDHDVAFPGRLGKRVHRRVLERMLRAQRFSRSFYESLVELDRGCFVRELARDPAWDNGKLLDHRSIDGVFERRETAKTHVESLIQLHGEESVLVFP